MGGKEGSRGEIVKVVAPVSRKISKEAITSVWETVDPVL